MSCSAQTSRTVLLAELFSIILFLVTPLQSCRARSSSHIAFQAFRVYKKKLPISVASVRLFATKSMSIQNEKVRHVSKDLLPDWMLAERTKILSKQKVADKDSNDKSKEGSVVYWMQRDVRTADNWALLLASHLATSRKVPLHVVYALPPPNPAEDDDDAIPDLAHLPMTERHGKFLLGGLKCVHTELKEHEIPLHVVMPESYDDVGEAVCKTLMMDDLSCQTVVTDMSPLRHYREWTELQALPILDKHEIPFYQVDTHNIVPVWIASDKREYGARTIRPKIHKNYSKYLQKFPKLKEFNFQANKDMKIPKFEQKTYEDFLQMDESVGELDWAKPGTDAALKQAEHFFNSGLKKFSELRNDPTKKDIISNLSPWINHGHVSFQRLALAVKKLNKYASSTAAFIEEGVVRRELSDNFVYYSPNDYDSLTTAPAWAQETLQTHASDPREYVYSLQEFEQGKTHDDLWNAAQLQAVQEGKIHGFMRMYWAKKILEWTESPEIALKTALYLNDKFNVDGRCPNGFVGVGWSIMGIHDQGWKEREVFGKIRYMNYNGCKRKFKVPDFVARYKGASENAEKAANKNGNPETKKRSQPKSSSGSKKKAKASSNQ